MNQKHFSPSRIALAVLLAAAPMASWAAIAPNLGTASSFAVLGVGTANPPSTNADATTAVTTTRVSITGDVGSAGAVSFGDATSPSVITGSVLLNGAYTQVPAAPPLAYSGSISPLPVQVINDFNTAYNALAPIQGECTTTNTLSGTLNGAIVSPGVYCVDAVAKAGTLTLNGPSNGVWIFKVLAIPQTPTLTGALTGTNFSVVMAGGGNACNVTWWVAEAATMTTSGFQGTILAGAAITLTGLAGTTTPFNGDIMARAGVTVTDVTVTGCGGTLPPPPPPPPVCDGDHDGHDGDHDGHDGHHDGHDGHHDGHDKERCDNGHHNGHDKDHKKCNQGVGNGPEGCDPGNSNLHNPYGSNDEHGGKPGNPGRKGGKK